MAKELDDSLFDDAPHPENADDDHLFDDSPHPELASRTLASTVDSQNNEAALNLPDVSASRAALVGAGQGSTFGFAEELTAPIVSAAAMTHDAFSSPENEMVPTLPGGESTWDKFQRLMQDYRDVARDEQKGAQGQHPGEYTAGAVAGGIAAPGLGLLKGASMAAKGLQAAKVPALIAKTTAGAGAGYLGGGAGGLGEAEGSLEERLPQAQETAEMGGVVGAAIPVVGAGLSTAGRAAGQIGQIPVISKSIEAFKRGVKSESLVTEAGRREAADIVREKSGSLFDDIKKLQENVGTKIQNEIDAAQESGAKIDLTEEIDDVLARLQKIKAEGSKEAAAYAAGVEAEIKKILKIKPKESGFMGVAEDALPEGLILPKAATASKKIDPKQAQDLKQVLYNYTPKKMMAPQEIEPAKVAKDLYGRAGKFDPEAGEVVGGSGVSGKLNELTENLPQLNKEYGIIKDSLKRLNVNEKALPSQIKEKINRVMARLGDESTPGDDARELVADVLADIKQVSPEIAAKYSAELGDISQRLKLSKEITKGLQAGLSVGTVQGLTKAGANITGLVAGKLGGAKIGAGIKGTANFANEILQSDAVKRGAVKYETQGTDALKTAAKAVEPHQLQRQVAQAAENAEPELLKDQATNIRTQYGKQGEQLAIILDNMAGKDKNARRALMFTILQNQAYRKMLGLMDKEQ